jgi:hypothetical protein
MLISPRPQALTLFLLTEVQVYIVEALFKCVGLARVPPLVVLTARCAGW